jgi:DNA-binding winged helix-turn-helix (wHTH) protein
MRVRFGDCVFDSETRELTRDGRAVRLSPKAFQLLGLLLETRPKALSKDHIHAALWPKTFVADTALTTLVKELRAAIGEEAEEPRFVRTLPAFGYAFSGEAREVRRRPATGFFCRLIGPDSEVGLSEGDNVVGRGPESVLWVDDDTVSRAHARVRVEGLTVTLEDLDSRNGTFVGKRRIHRPTVLRDGDQIRLGHFRLTFRASGSPESTKSTSPPRRRSP